MKPSSSSREHAGDVPAQGESCLDRDDLLCIILISFAFVALAGGTIDWHGYWADEFHTTTAVSLPIRQLVTQRAVSGHPPLFYLVEKLWIQFFGASEQSYRWPALLCGLGAILLTYAIVRRQATRPSALCTCLVLATAATQLLVCQLARSYTMLQLFVTANAALIVSTSRATPWRLALSGTVCAAAMYTHGAALLAVPIQLLAAGLLYPTRWKHVVAGVLGCLAYGPFVLLFPTMRYVAHHAATPANPPLVDALRFPATLEFGRQLEQSPTWLQAATVVLVLASIAICVRRGRAARFLGLQFILTWASGIGAIALGMGLISVERYFAPALVCQASLMGMALDPLAQRSRIAGVAWSTAVIALCITTASLYFAVPPFTSWREMATLIDAKRNAEDVIVVACPKSYAVPFDYYFSGRAEYADAVNPTVAHSTSGGIWVCLPVASDGAELAAIPPELRASFPRVTRYSLRRGCVLHLQPAAGPRANGDSDAKPSLD